jgi:putative ABC transport system ATP-binding protein
MKNNGHADAPLLRTDRVSRLYPDGEVTALREVTLEVPRGRYLAIMGPSGSGKSTLLNLLGGLDRPTSGEVFFQEEPLSQMPSLDDYRAHQVGFVFQSFLLLPTLTSSENVQIPMFETNLSARSRAAKARELLDAVGMSHRATHLPHRMSVGERQRVAVARELANDPPLLLADVPTGNLDSQSGAAVLELFDQLHRQRGMTLVVITHSDEVAARAEETLYLRDGRIVAPSPAAVSG